jgi:hypothetical protein
MSDFQTRGYLIATTARFFRDGVGDKEWERIRAGFSTPLQQVLAGSMKPAAWYPISIMNELNRGIAATIGRGDDETARDAFFRCGKFSAREATNSFLKMFLKILTPALFAKKLPDVFKRDFTSGRLEVEVKDHTLTCRMYEMPGFEHGGALCPGFASFPLESMGKSIEKVKVHDWSLAAPNVDGTWFELTWKD